ncbi:MAG: AMP-binding protein [Gammaproteobacteria bacterium]|jgi:long-subunit acyl-CoA synthetase (AMP-forming)|nr:AMP-binding protein [Gammaproteobacteria bacterium]
MTTDLFACLHDRARQTPRRPAIVSEAESWSYRELHCKVMELSRWLKRQRVEVVALLADNSPAWVLADLACLHAGVTLIPIPGFFSESQRRHVLEDSGAEAIMAPVVGDLVSVTRLPGIGLSWQPLAPGDGARVSWPVAKVTYTSGTTGQPRGVCLSAGNQLKVARGVRETACIDAPRHLANLPLSTLLENVAGLYQALLAGGVVLLPSLEDLGYSGSAGLDVQRWYGTLNRWQPETLIMIPEMLRGLLNVWRPDAPLARSLRFAAVGGGHVAPALLEQAVATGIPVYQGYGLSECGSVVALNVPAHNRCGSVGRILPHLRVRIAEDGEVLVSGNAFLGYLGHLSEQARWLPTGDLGRLDDGGYLHIEGRKKNLLITSYGRNLSPEWVEAELLSLGGIRQAAVFGDARPFNVALLATDPDLLDADLLRAIESLNERLPDYARIACWQRLQEPFTPANGLTTENGRLRRERIAERYASLLTSLFEVPTRSAQGG